jgi:hypothetical protein
MHATQIALQNNGFCNVNVIWVACQARMAVFAFLYAAMTTIHEAPFGMRRNLPIKSGRTVMVYVIHLLLST